MLAADLLKRKSAKKKMEPTKLETPKIVFSQRMRNKWYLTMKQATCVHKAAEKWN